MHRQRTWGDLAARFVTVVLVAMALPMASQAAERVVLGEYLNALW